MINMIPIKIKNLHFPVYVMNALSHYYFIQQSPQHMTNNNSPPHVMQGGNNMVNMHQQQMQPQMSPPQQMVLSNRQQVQQMQVNSPQLCNSASNSPSYNQNMSTVSGIVFLTIFFILIIAVVALTITIISRLQLRFHLGCCESSICIIYRYVFMLNVRYFFVIGIFVFFFF